MSILTTSRHQRHYFSVTRLPKRETRIAEKPAAPFAEGLVVDKPGRSTPIDQRTLPTIEGAGLTTAEWFTVNGRSNQVKAEYARSMPDATDAELHAIGQRAATDALRQVLKARPAAPALKPVPAKVETTNRRVDAPAKPVSRPVRTPIRRMSATIRPSHTASDEAWWATNSPSCRLGFYVEGTTDPSDPFNWTMPAMEFRAAMMATCELSDDANGQFGYVREGASL